MTNDSILAPVASLTLPDSAALTGRAERALSFIREFTIGCAEDYTLAADELMAIKARAKDIESQRTSITGPMNTALKAINDLFRAPASMLEQAEQILKTKMLAWDHEQRRIAEEARRQAEAAAAAERRRLALEAEQRQREAQAQAAAAAQAQAKGDTQAADLARAAAERSQAEAAVAANTAQMVVAPVFAPPVAAVKGISSRTSVDFEVTSLSDLVKHIAEHPELINLLRTDDTKLRAYVRGLGTACKLPGVRVYEKSTLSARAA